MWDQADEVIEAELGPGERLLWAGRPPLGLKLRAADAVLIPFSLMWGGFAIFWETMVVRGGAPWFFVLWGIPFVLIGLYLIAGRFVVDARQRAKTFYAVTSERVIIVSGLFLRRVKSLNLDTLTDVSLTERNNGAGTITFGPAPPMAGWYSGGSWPGMGNYLFPSFELSSDARSVYEIIRSAQRAAKKQA
jgi:Bacterial PH domain